jgi:4-amino-4-deoxy-L-arabinose transferase-like glycosyltransferase
VASQESPPPPAGARLPDPQPSSPFVVAVPRPLERFGWWPALLAGALALTVYVLTLAPGLTFDNYGTDGGDLITAAYSLGVPHPTGYPTYTLLAWLFTRLPLGVIAYRVNLLSAFCAAGTVVLTFRIAQYLLPAAGPELDVSGAGLLPSAVALNLAFSSLLWSQAVISEVYALLAFLAALLFWLLLRWQEGGRAPYLWLAALVFGLGLGNHVTLAFAALFALVLLWPQRARWWRPPVLLAILCFFLAGLGVYAYLPLAARHQPLVNWGNPQTWRGFLWVVTAKQYQPFAFGLDMAAIPGRLAAWAGLLGQQFGWWGLVLVLVGAWSWWRRDRVLSLAALTWMLSVGGYAFLYDTGDSHIYLISVLPFLALCWGEGVVGLIRMVRSRARRWRRLVLVAIALLPLLSLGLHWGDADPDDDWQVHTYCVQVLAAVEPGALILVRGDRPTFALWYAVYAERQRTDVAIVSGPLLAFVWYREHVRHLYPHLVVQEPEAGKVTIDDLVRDTIAKNLERLPVYATDPSDAWKTAYDFVRVGDAQIYRAVEGGGASQ